MAGSLIIYINACNLNITVFKHFNTLDGHIYHAAINQFENNIEAQNAMKGIRVDDYCSAM